MGMKSAFEIVQEIKSKKRSVRDVITESLKKADDQYHHKNIVKIKTYPLHLNLDQYFA